VAVFLSITTLDPDLAQRLEPRAVSPARRLAAIRGLSDAGVPTGVLAAPMIPGLTDQELPSILSAAAGSGARFAGYVPLRLPHSVSLLFEEWLAREAPKRKSKVLNRIRSIRGGALNDPEFGSRMQGVGPYAKEMRDLFLLGCRRAGLKTTTPSLSAQAFAVPHMQRSLF
jgi:DNA repair photolyase